MAFITAIATQTPAYRYSKTEMYQYMVQALHAQGDQARKMHFLYEKSRILHKYSVLEDFKIPIERQLLFKQTNPTEPLISERLKIYMDEAPKLASEAILKINFNPNDITHFITVSCTGLAAPGIDIILIKQLGLPTTVARSAVNFMGCYAAIHALKQANAICNAQPNAKVLIVCVELCSLHYTANPSWEAITSNMLFGDGAAAVMVSSKQEHPDNLSITGFHSDIYNEGITDMAWTISEHGFLMQLSAYVPELIEKGITPLVQGMLTPFNISHKAITHWAIHPGGAAILERIARELELEPTDLQASYETLANFGNMSSPTILFVLKNILDRLDTTLPARVFCASFGPGLSLESMLLTHETA